MARWDWMGDAQNNGDVLVVCGGWHAPALAKMWRECPQVINTPELLLLDDAVTGCYLTPYSEKRLDVLGRIPFWYACPGLAKLVLAVGPTAGR